MRNLTRTLLVVALVGGASSQGILAQQAAQPPAAPQGGGRQGQPQPMTFFVTSVSKGDGANYGGLAGADAHCQSLAAAAGRGDVKWVAYLSTQGAERRERAGPYRCGSVVQRQGAADCRDRRRAPRRHD